MLIKGEDRFMSAETPGSQSGHSQAPINATRSALGQPPLRALPQRIVVLHLDSLCCLPAMNALFASLGGRIVLLMSSDRFGGPLGFLRQLAHNIARSGLRMTVALGFDIVALRIAAFLAPTMRLLVGRLPHWRSPRELAASVGAACRAVPNINAAPVQELMQQLRPDLVLSLHFDQVLRMPFLEAVACPVVNVHPALLPAHRGPCPAFWTLLGGDECCGVTVHRILDEAIDAGPILARRARPVPATFCMGELDELLFLEGVETLLELLCDQSKEVPDSPGGPPRYEGFPSREIVGRAHRTGVRLWRLTQVVRLIGGLFGWCLPAGPSAA